MTPAPPFRPYPWATLDHTTRAEARALSLARRWSRGRVDLGKVAESLGALLGVEVSFRVREALPLSKVAATNDDLSVLLASGGSPADGVLVVAEPALVATCLRRIARRRAPFAFDPAAPLPPGAAGAFAAVLCATWRRAHDGSAVRVIAAGNVPRASLAVPSGASERIAVSLTVLVEHDAFLAQVVVPGLVEEDVAAPPFDSRVLQGLGALPLDVPLVAWTAALPASEVARLEIGAVLLLDGWQLRSADGHLAGPVWLAAPTGELALGADLAADGRLVLRGDPVRVSPQEASMSEAIDKGEWLDTIGDVPVTVRVEIGEARMAAREWASLGRGDVVTLGRRVGEPVVLRVGGLRVARGELVEIDGEVGVRVLERFADDAAGAAR